MCRATSSLPSRTWVRSKLEPPFTHLCAERARASLHTPGCRVNMCLPSCSCVQSEHVPPFTRGHVLTGQGGGAGPPGGRPSTGKPFPGARAPAPQLRQACAIQRSHSHLGLAEPPDLRLGVGLQPPAYSCPRGRHPPFQGNLCPLSGAKEFSKLFAAFSTKTLELWILVRTLPMTPGRPSPLSSLLCLTLTCLLGVGTSRCVAALPVRSF